MRLIVSEVMDVRDFGLGLAGDGSVAWKIGKALPIVADRGFNDFPHRFRVAIHAGTRHRRNECADMKKNYRR